MGADFAKEISYFFGCPILHSVLRNFNTEEGLILCVEALYKNVSSAVLLGSQVGEYFKTTVGVRQDCLLSPVLFNLFLENIMRETLHDFTPTVSIGERPLCNLRFADDIDLIAGSNSELQDLTDRLTSRSTAHGMEVSSEKSKVLVNADNKKANIIMHGEHLEEVDTFKYLGASITKDGRSTSEVKTRLAIATSSMARLLKIWKSKEISFTSKFKLFKSLVLSIALYGCEGLTLSAKLEKNRILRNEVPPAPAWDLVEGKEDQRVCKKHHQQHASRQARRNADHCKEEEPGVVRSCDTPPDIVEDHSTGYCTRGQKTGKTKEAMDGQHQRLDRRKRRGAPQESRGPKCLANAVT